MIGMLGVGFVVLGLGMLVAGEAWWAGRRVRRLREPRHYWTSLGTCGALALICFVVALLR